MTYSNLQHTKVEISPPISTRSRCRIRDGGRYAAQKRGVLRIQDAQCARGPVDFDGKVVPCVRGKGCDEEDVECVIEYFERMCVWSGEWACRVRKRRAYKNKENRSMI